MDRRLKGTLAGGRFTSVRPGVVRRMSAIRGKGNRTTESRFRAILARAHINGWTMHPDDVVGRPDFYFAASRIAVFIDGCFWHGCAFCYGEPKTRAAFWAEKRRLNRLRDRRVGRQLARSDVLVMRVWEHELRSTPVARLELLRSQIAQRLGGNNAPGECPCSGERTRR